jgi:hypothetical protein
MQMSGTDLHKLTTLAVDPEHFDYLAIQRGDINRYADCRRTWQHALEAVLEDTLKSLIPALPYPLMAVLDIGSGLGAIDVVLYRYCDSIIDIGLLDGTDDRPHVDRRNKTFSNRRVSTNFLTRNGVPPQVLHYYSPGERPKETYDLVLSLASWCFHYPPEVYLEMVMDCCLPHSCVIVDLRKNEPSWLAQLEARLRPVKSLKVSAKFERIAFVPK